MVNECDVVAVSRLDNMLDNKAALLVLSCSLVVCVPYGHAWGMKMIANVAWNRLSNVTLVRQFCCAPRWITPGLCGGLGTLHQTTFNGPVHSIILMCAMIWLKEAVCPVVASSADNHKNNCHFDITNVTVPTTFGVTGAIVNYTRHLVEPYPLSQSLSLPSFSSLRGNPIGQKHPKTRQLGVCSSALCWR